MKWKTVYHWGQYHVEETPGKFLFSLGGMKELAEQIVNDHNKQEEALPLKRTAGNRLVVPAHTVSLTPEQLDIKLGKLEIRANGGNNRSENFPVCFMDCDVLFDGKNNWPIQEFVITGKQGCLIEIKVTMGVDYAVEQGEDTNAIQSN